MFGNAFRKIWIALIVLALLAGLGAGVLFGVIPALRYDVWRAEPDEEISTPQAETPTPSPEASMTPELTQTPIPIPATAEEWVERYMTTMTTQEKLGRS
ncbi:MAG: hypothetical protein R2881_05770 [Eubacteriales bacterium]